MRNHIIVVKDTTLAQRIKLINHFLHLGEEVNPYSGILNEDLDNGTTVRNASLGIWELSRRSIDLEEYKALISIDAFIKKFPVKPILDLRDIYEQY